MKLLLLASLCVLGLSQDETPSAEAQPASRLIGEQEGTIETMVVTPDGKTLITSNALEGRSEVRSYDVKDGDCEWVHSIKAPAMGLSVGDDLLAFHQGMPAASLLDLGDGEGVRGVGTLAVQERCSGIALDSKDEWVWFGVASGDVLRVKCEDVNQWDRCPMDTDSVTAIALDGRGKTLAVGCGDGTVRFVDAGKAKRDEKTICEGHESEVTALAIDAKGGTVVSASSDGDVRVWKASKGKQLHLLARHEAAVTCLALDSKAKRLATGDRRGIVNVWDLKSGDHLLELSDLGGAVQGLAFVEKDKTLATTASSPQITLWDLSDL